MVEVSLSEDDCEDCVRPATRFVHVRCSHRSTRTLNRLVVSALGLRARGPGFDFRVAPLFHWAETLGKLFTHIASPVSQLQENGVQKGVFGA